MSHPFDNFDDDPVEYREASPIQSRPEFMTAADDQSGESLSQGTEFGLSRSSRRDAMEAGTSKSEDQDSPDYVMSQLYPQEELKAKKISAECEEQYNGYYAKTKDLSAHETVLWFEVLEKELGQNFDLFDYLDWADEKDKPPAQPNYNLLPPEQFGNMLQKAEWKGDTASRIVFGRLWESPEFRDQDLFLWGLGFDMLTVRLNGHVVTPKPLGSEGSPDPYGMFEVSTLMPSPFVTLRYEREISSSFPGEPPSSQETSATQCVLVLGKILHMYS